MTWTFIWMALVLKIPVFALLWICWWAVKAEPDPVDGDRSGGGGGGSGHPTRPRRPRPPRRGEHGDPAPRAPARVRALAKRSDSVPHE
jgi:hypothetical protein